MQALQSLCHAIMVAALLVAACGSAHDPYEKIPDPPLVQARLHAITLVSDSDAVVERIRGSGYQPVRLAPNYERAVAVEASIWGVAEPVAAAIQDFKSPKLQQPDLRLLVMPDFEPEPAAAKGSRTAFFRNVLGTDAPAWPLNGSPDSHARVRILTYLISDVVAASRRFRENSIPVIYGPVGLTTSYLGDHRTVAIRAPDGTVVQLVQTATQ
jgi:hypothetical protein